MTYLKYILGLVILGGVLWAGITYPQFPLSFGSSTVGSTFNTAKFAGVAISLASPGTNATSTSILNTDTNDRYVSAYKIGCENVGTSQTAYTGTGLAALLFSVGTTTTANPVSFSSFAAVATNQTVATGTSNFLMASSTLATGTKNAAIWPTGTYMTFYFNATNTAACTVGVDYFGS